MYRDLQDLEETILGPVIQKSMIERSMSFLNGDESVDAALTLMP